MATDAREKQFWGWFVANASQLSDSGHSSAAFTAELDAQAALVAEGITCEIGPLVGNCRELTISAGGLVALIPAVLHLAQAAPALDGWKVVTFRRPRPFDGESFTSSGKVVPLSDVTVVLTREVRKISITLLFEEFSDHEYDTWGDIGFSLLDRALGEYTVMTQVGTVDFSHPSQMPPTIVTAPATDLAVQFETFRAAYSTELNALTALTHTERMKLIRDELLHNDHMRWNSIEREQLIGEPLAVHYGFFTHNMEVAEKVSKCLSETFDGEVTIQREYTAAGEGLVVGGSTTIEPSALSTLTTLTSNMVAIAERFNVEFDGYALQKAAQFTETDLFSMGCQQLLQGQKYDEAIALCEQGLSLHEDHPELLSLYAYCLAKIGEEDSAIVVLEKLPGVLESATDDVPATNWNAACSYALLNRAQEAIHFLTCAIENNPEFLEMARSDPDFDIIRSHTLFSNLLAN